MKPVNVAWESPIDGSPPVRGAWIETCCRANIIINTPVAPRAGGVD